MSDAAMPQPSEDPEASQKPISSVEPALRTAVTLRDDAALAARHREVIAAATSDNTRQVYRSAIRHYLTWGGRLPASEMEVVHYLLAYAEILNPRTLALRLTALSQWHIHQGFANPAGTATVRKTMKGLLRTYGRPKRKARALPIEDLESVAAGLVQTGTLKALRDSALLQLGFFGGFRRAELVSIEVEHVAWERPGILITLPRSKTDQEGEGIVKAIPYAGGGPLCPATALRAWLDAAGIQTGPVFRSVSKWGRLGKARLRPAAVNEILASAARLAKLDYAPELSAHSLRRGMATSAHRAGTAFLDIKKQGGWRHDSTVQGYIEEARMFEENAAGILLRSRPSST